MIVSVCVLVDVDISISRSHVRVIRFIIILSFFLHTTCIDEEVVSIQVNQIQSKCSCVVVSNHNTQGRPIYCTHSSSILLLLFLMIQVW
jgi:hypothetical protein